ncbi:MAG: DUF11 domain-containing protein [Pseudomonadota bacterium]
MKADADRALRRALARAVACLLLLLCQPAMADTPIALFKSFAGNVNFVGTQKTLRTKANGVDACAVTPAATATTATLSGIPAGAVVLSAQLYWAGSGGAAARDYTIKFENVVLTAPVARQYNSATVGYDFFGGAVDVTTQVVAKRNGTYSFSDLTVDTSNTYCAVEAVLGGWALAVIYSAPTETFRVLNIYEGFQYIRSSSVTLTLSNFNIPILTPEKTGRIGHVTWEGDSSILGGGEDLLFNNVALTDAMNPSGNQFNSSSNVNSDPNSYGVDFDAYTLTDPVIKQGQTSATTIYRSGTDLVIMSSEIIAVPNTPTADLGITMTRDQTLTLGQTANYFMTVKNNGPQAEPGPIVVTDVLPANLGLVAVGGEDWNCTVTGQNVTCTYLLQLEVGASAPVLTLLVMVNSNNPSSMTNTAAVDGGLFDNVAGNNSASDTATIATPSYVFTDAICINNVAFGSSQPCKFISFANRIAGVPISPIYVTNLNAAGVPTFISSTVDTTLGLRFALSCHNPVKDAGTQANFPNASTLLPLCAQSAATPTIWTASMNFTFVKSVPSTSTGMVFDYADAGRIKLFLSDSNGKTGATGPFVMRPDKFLLSAYRVLSPSGTWNNPAATLPTLGAATLFARAGEVFTMDVKATTRHATILLTKNYGNETPVARGVQLTVTPARDPRKSAAQAASNPYFDDMSYQPALQGTIGAFNAGIATYDKFIYDEVGILAVAASAPGGDYLGAGTITSAAINVGRFVPNHFDTTVPVLAPLIACPTKLACVAVLQNSMVYSTQPFGATVTARHLNGTTTLINYQGEFARAVTLEAWDKVGSTTQKNPPATPSGSTLKLSSGAGTVAATAFAAGVAAPQVNYALANPYLDSAPRALNWAPPTAIYIRATDAEAVTSLRAPVGAVNPTVEGGAMIVNGRLLLSNAYGSELLGLPVTVTAQYWNGSAWTVSSTDTSVPVLTGITFQNCIKALQSSAATPGNCKPALSSVGSPPALSLTAGVGTVRLNATGAGNAGSGELLLIGPSWLPSTRARVTFGVYKSGPVTYVRELY